jgi:hypothetical protein
MLQHTHHRRLLATVATTAALATTAPAALAMPVDAGGSVGTTPASEPERVRVVRVQVDEGLDWSDAGIGAAGMLALVLVGYGGAHALTTGPGRTRSAAHS